MLYSTFLKKTARCPFCAPRQRTIAENRRAFLTYSIAPYAEYHLLVIPKRHAVAFPELSAAESRDVQAMLTAGVRVLEGKGIEDYSILVRNGGMTGRSVQHLHYHLIPRHRIGDLDHEQNLRKVLTERQIRALLAETKGVLRKPSARVRKRGKTAGRRT